MISLNRNNAVNAENKELTRSTNCESSLSKMKIKKNSCPPNICNGK